MIFQVFWSWDRSNSNIHIQTAKKKKRRKSRRRRPRRERREENEVKNTVKNTNFQNEVLLFEFRTYPLQYNFGGVLVDHHIMLATFRVQDASKEITALNQRTPAWLHQPFIDLRKDLVQYYRRENIPHAAIFARASRNDVICDFKSRAHVVESFPHGSCGPASSIKDQHFQGSRA